MCIDLVHAVTLLVHHFERFVDTLRSMMAIILASAVADETRLLSISTELCHIFIFLLS
jgi:hypothetical protein